MTPESEAVAGIANRCPVCNAGFRGARICSRCGANLETLMYLTAKAWKLRQQARAMLLAGDVESALQLASASEEIQCTPSGAALVKLSKWLSHFSTP